MPLSISEKIFGLSSIWMEVRRNFPYRERLENLDADYRTAIEAVSSAPDLKSYYRELQIFLAKLQDGHTFVRLPEGMYMTRSRPSVGVMRVGTLAVVTWVRSDLATQIPLGSVVEQVDGKPYALAAEQAKSTISFGAPHKREDDAYVLAMEGEKGSTVTLHIATPQAQTARPVQLVRGQVWPDGASILSLYQDPTEVVALNYLDGNRIVLLEIHSFSNMGVYDKFLELIPALKLARHIVLDLRKNHGGNSEVGYKILSHFLARPVKSSASSKFIYDFTHDAKGWDGDTDPLNLPVNRGMVERKTLPDMILPGKKSLRLHGKVVVLTGPQTTSAAEDFLVAASSMQHTRIGATTAGSTGQPIVVPLPGGGEAYILTKRDVFPSGREFVGVGIRPDIEICPTLEEVRSGRDIVIERVLERLKSGCL